ncbi:MAG: PD-(D/E)XK nuclease family transposase [Erysipelotrichaceae bacterium]|nr:PD-(D/E)XK nuclease family transposase [Erysipelotrichaceae bacterium]
MNHESYKLNLRNDYVFKMMHYMDEEKGKKIFTHMVKAFTGLEVTNVVFKPTDLYPMNVNGKDVRFDLRASVDTKSSVEVEMQVYHMSGLTERIAYYSAMLFTSSNNKGDAYTELEQVTCLALCANNVFPELKNYSHTFAFKSMENGAILTEKMKTHIIEMKKCVNDILETKGFENLTMMEKWIYFLMRYEQDTDDPIILKLLETEEIFRIVEEVLQMISRDELAKERAIARDMWAKDMAQLKLDRETVEARSKQVQKEYEALFETSKMLNEQNKALDEENKVLDEKVTALEEVNRRSILAMIKAGLNDEFIVENTGCTFEYLKSLKESR